MKRQANPIVTLALGAIFLSAVLCPAARAQGLLNESGRAVLAPQLAPTGGIAVNPQEYPTISWSVVENAPNNYTYSYTVNNPANDVLLNPDGTLTSTPEIVDEFEVTFNTTTPGAYISGTQTGGGFDQATSVELSWAFSAVNPGGNSGLLAFQSALAPGFGNASADGASPPAPWASTSPNGQQVSIPRAIPEPPITTLLALALLLLPFRSSLRRRLL